VNIHNQMDDFVSFFSGDDELEASQFTQYGLKPDVKHFKKGEFLIRQGKVDSKLYFLTKGFARYVSVSCEGKEFTQTFASAPCVAGSARSMAKNMPALFSIEALDDVVCLEFEWPDFFSKMKGQVEFLKAYNRLLGYLFLVKEEREYAFVQHNAERRYLNFLQAYPTLQNLIPVKMIASHIGITPIALSRIRKNLESSGG